MKWGKNGIDGISSSRKTQLGSTTTNYFPKGSIIKSAEWNFMANLLLDKVIPILNRWSGDSKLYNVDWLWGGVGNYRTSREISSIFSLRGNHVIMDANMTRVDLGNHLIYRDVTNRGFTSSNTSKRYSIITSFATPIVGGSFTSSFENTKIIEDLNNGNFDQYKFDHQPFGVEFLSQERKDQLATIGYVPNDLIRAYELNYLYGDISKDITQMRNSIIDWNKNQKATRENWKNYESLMINGVAGFGVQASDVKRAKWIYPWATFFKGFYNSSKTHNQFSSLGYNMSSSLSKVYQQYWDVRTENSYDSDEKVY